MYESKLNILQNIMVQEVNNFKNKYFIKHDKSKPSAPKLLPDHRRDFGGKNFEILCVSICYRMEQSNNVDKNNTYELKTSGCVIK